MISHCQEEIKELREQNTNLKLKLSNINEESHKLEISKLNILISSRDRELNLEKNENFQLKEQLNTFDKYFKNIIVENSNYRKDIDEKVKIYLNR